MGIPAGNLKKEAVYPVANKMGTATRVKEKESYMVHLAKRLLENYRALFEMAEYTK